MEAQITVVTLESIYAFIIQPTSRWIRANSEVYLRDFRSFLSVESIFMGSKSICNTSIIKYTRKSGFRWRGFGAALLGWKIPAVVSTYANPRRNNSARKYASSRAENALHKITIFQQFHWNSSVDREFSIVIIAYAFCNTVSWSSGSIRG